MSINDFVKDEVESELNDHELILESDSRIQDVLEGISVLKYGLDSRFIERDNNSYGFEFALRKVKHEIKYQEATLRQIHEIGDYKINDLTAEYYGITQSDIDEVFAIAKEAKALDKQEEPFLVASVLTAISIFLFVPFMFFSSVIVGILGSAALGFSFFTFLKRLRKIKKTQKKNEEWATHLYDLDSRPDLNLVPEHIKKMKFSEVKKLAAEKQKTQFTYPINESTSAPKQDELLNQFAFTEVFETKKSSRKQVF